MIRSLSIISVLLSFYFSALSFAAVPFDLELGRYTALIISNQNYKTLTPLKTPHADADALANVLRSDYGFRVTMLRDTNRAGTLDALDQLVEKLTPNDNLLIFYAGHGHLDKATGEGYWLPVTASPRRRSEWISNADVTDTLRATVAKHVLVISDSCFSGTLSRSAAAGLNVGKDRDKRKYFAKLAERKSRTALSSGGLEPVDDGGGSGHSVFAGALITALKRNNEPILEAENLYSQIKRPVALNSSSIQKPQYSDVHATGHDEGDFLFFKRNIRAVSKPAASVKPSVSGVPVTGVDTKAAYELTFWNSIKDSKDVRDFSAYLETYPQGKFAVLANLRMRQLAPVHETETSQAESVTQQEKSSLLAAADINSNSKIIDHSVSSLFKSKSNILSEPKVIPRLASVKKSEHVLSSKRTNKPADNVLVVLATPDNEYSPRFNTVDAYSKAVAGVAKKFFNNQSWLYLPKKDLARQVIDEDEAHTTSKKLCQQYQTNGVLSIELDLSRDMDELSRTPDNIYFGFYNCKNNRYNLAEYSIDFLIGEEFSYAIGIKNTLNEFNKKYLLSDQ